MILSAKDISKDYKRIRENANYFTAVQKTNITLEPGKLTVVTGRSGSGKTTLMHMLCGLLTPTDGKVLIDNTDLYALNDAEGSKFRNLHFGIMPQDRAAVGSLTVRENILLPCCMYRSANDACEKADELMGTLNISSLANEYPSDLSGGELRRMIIARALAGAPEFIFADEPTADLDDENTEVVLKLLRARADRGTSVFLVTHETAAIDYADTHLVMNSGNLSLEA